MRACRAIETGNEGASWTGLLVIIVSGSVVVIENTW